MAVNLLKRPKKSSKVREQKIQMRNSLWPQIDEESLWHYKKTDGWLTIPRAMPLVLRVMDMLAPKGKPVSQTYLDLWCRTYDDAFVIASKRREMAYYSGFTGERAEHTWATRIKILEELGFILTKEGAGGPHHYILILNPFHVIRRHSEKRQVPPAAYNALQDRLIEVGATDLAEPAEAS